MSALLRMPVPGAVCRASAFFARYSHERGLRFTSAEPNIQRLQTFSHERHWIPAFAGMTVWKERGLRFTSA
ncbi:hypothetical protein [Lysobacter gummosus]|uniref:hypothetical protein n=1 Tax=Lysobacter gummosus TaxID=262324 RepID=UPI003628B761